MTIVSKPSFRRRLTIGRKLATIPILFAAATAGILAYTVITAQDQKQDAHLVHMAARQRMLVQRQLAQVLLVSQGFEAVHELPNPLQSDALMSCCKNADYLVTRRLLSDTLESLLNGGPVIDLLTGEFRDLPPAPNQELRDELREQKAALTAFADAADRYLKLDKKVAARDPALRELLDLNYAAEMSSLKSTKLFAAYSQSKIATMIWRETAISIVVAVLALAYSWIVTRSIVNPLGNVVSLAQQIGRGDLNGQKLADTSGDEVGELAVTFNEMLDNLRSLATQTRDVTSNLNAAAAEILASTQQQATGTKEQAATIQQITATMGEVRQSGIQITERAKQVAAAAEASASSTVVGLSTVQEANRTMESIRQQIEDVAENIVALSEKTQAVSEIIATVNDIAERSNLLALNAAIEAAAAGEQGNRFSVVANEIKNLADQAKESTVQVRTILEDIQKRINSSVMLTEEAVKRAETGKQQADVSEQTIRRLADTTQESVQAFQQIIGATGQQQIGFEQVTQGMQDIGQAASQTAAGTVQLEKAVASLNSQSHQLREAVGRYQL